MAVQDWKATRRADYQAALQGEHEEGVQAGYRWYRDDTDIDGDVQVRLDRLRQCECHAEMSPVELADILFDGLDEESAESFWQQWAGSPNPSPLYLHGFLFGASAAFDSCNSGPIPLAKATGTTQAGEAVMKEFGFGVDEF